MTHAPRARNHTQPTAAPSAPGTTAQEGAHQTTSGRERAHTAIPTARPQDALDPLSVTPTQVPPTVTEEQDEDSDPARPEMPSRKPVPPGDRFPEDSRFLTVNPGKLPPLP